MLNIGRLRFLIHYLDDHFLANVSRETCQANMDTFLHICSKLGVPIADDKLEGPSMCLTYLGIEIDTVSMTVRLPAEKLSKLKSMVLEWAGRRKCRKRDLLSLIGFLAFACKVVKPGRIFLRRLIDLASSVDSLHHYIYMNAEARADIDWWVRFLPDWHGVAIIHPTPITQVELQLSTDASNLGFGCVYGNHWLYASWVPEWAPSKECHINVRELFAVWAAVYTWGEEWANREVVIFSDNKAVIDIWFTGSCKDRKMMSLIRSLFFRTAELNINLLLSFVPGRYNINADLLSRLQVQEFKRSLPTADKEPSHLSEAVWTLPGTS